MAVEICKKCNGSGEITIDVGTHTTDLEYHNCNNCKGSGKVICRSFSYEIPYDSENGVINHYELEIFNLLRKLESETRK